MIGAPDFLPIYANLDVLQAYGLTAREVLVMHVLSPPSPPANPCLRGANMDRGGIGGGLCMNKNCEGVSKIASSDFAASGSDFCSHTGGGVGGAS